MTTLRKHQNKTYWSEPTKESLFREAFGLPDTENPIVEVHSMLSMQGKRESFSGKLYLSDSFLTFASLDRRACRFSLPLATVRRVEKLAPGQEGTITGAFALSLTLFHGLRLVVQLNSLRPINDAFCQSLRERLKANLPLMKSLKPFSQTFFSEWFLASENQDGGSLESKAVAEKDAKVGELISLASEEKGKGKEDDPKTEWNTVGGVDGGYHGGLGLGFKYPGDPRKLREKSKMKLWKDYLRQHGRNLTLIRYPTFTRLVLVGLPNRLRGEIWELTCGSMFLRLQNPGVYAQILKENEGRTSPSTEDIEKDLHRSLPEYAAYQDTVGIDTMRRVLTAYAWSNPALGYCQAMNLIAASFLIYMSEEQCFWCLSVLCGRLVPGYYSPSMYGTVLDQRVFEHLVQKCLPTLHEHFASVDIQLSVASLPWFLSLYISSMPMVFAFRIIDAFFLMGPKVLFQVGLAILKVNGEELMETADDGAFINTLKAYFGTLGDSAYPDSTDSRRRQITRFQELFVVAFREFSTISDETIANERKRFRNEVVVSIENFAKRSAIRNLKRTGRLDKDRLGLAYDHFQLAVLSSRETSIVPLSPSLAAPTIKSPALPPKSPKEGEKSETRIDRKGFGTLISAIATWARDEHVVKNGFHEHIQRKPADHEVIDRIFFSWDKAHSGTICLQDVVDGLDSVLYNDLMSNIAWVFSLHDNDNDGYLTKDEVLQVSESLLFIFRNEHGDRYLGSVSNLLQNLFEYAESTKSVDETQAETEAPDQGQGHRRRPSLVSDNPHRPYLGLATFRMCVLADPLLEEFFESDLTNSWKLEVLIAEEKKQPPGAAGWLGGLMQAVLTDETKERLNRLADEVGRKLDIQTVEQLPSIGKFDASAASLEPIARDTLFSTSTAGANAPARRMSAEPQPNPLSAAAMRMPAYPVNENPWADVASSKRSRDIDVQAAAAQALERPQFIIDDAAEGDDEEYDHNGYGDVDLMDQVDTMLSQTDNVTSPP